MINKILKEKNIKNLIFDLGNVIIDLDFKACIKAFEKLGFKEAPKNLANMSAFENSLMRQFDIGKISAQEFRDEIKSVIGDKNISDSQINNAWNAMLGDIPLARIQKLAELKKRYNIFLLSNTNEIHINYVLNKFDYSHCFHKEYYSHKIGYRKPDKEAFEIIIKEQNIIPKETLFIDDLKKNIKTAKSLHFYTFLHNPEKHDICSIL